MKITIIGCGTMGKGLAQRLSPYHNMFLYDHHVEKAELLQREGYGTAYRQLQDAVQQSEIVMLAIKPQNLQEVAYLMYNESFTGTIISLLAGTTFAKLKEYFPTHRLIRMMPNLALIYGEGLIGLATDEPLLKEEKTQLSNMCEPLGKVYWLSEEKMNAFTALAGSGPAFVLVMIESMVDAGIAMGFPPHDAQELVHQMIKGSLHLLKESAKHPGELKWQVTSPGGTTIAGIKKLEELGMRSSIINTFLAAYKRAHELSS